MAVICRAIENDLCPFCGLLIVERKNTHICGAEIHNDYAIVMDWKKWVQQNPSNPVVINVKNLNEG